MAFDINLKNFSLVKSEPKQKYNSLVYGCKFHYRTQKTAVPIKTVWCGAVFLF